MRRFFATAAHVDFVLQTEHEGVTAFVARHKGNGKKFSVRIFDNILPTGGEAERDCSMRNFEYFQHLTNFFDSILAADHELTNYRDVSPLLAGFVEPQIYFWCFVAPRTLETIVRDSAPDVIILLCRAGGYFGRLLPCLEQTAGNAALLVGYSHALAQKRREVAGSIAGFVNYQPKWAIAGSADHHTSKAAAAADPGFALIMRQLRATADLSIWQHAPERPSDRRYGAVTTTEVGYVSYNYKFRQRLLARLARPFDLNLFALEISADDGKALRAELRRAQADSGRHIELTSYSPKAGALCEALADYLDRHRHLWQEKLVELSGGDWVLAIFDGLIFEPMVAQIFAGLEYAAYLRTLMGRHPPAFALSITGETSRTALLLAAARQARIPTFDMQVVAMNDDPRNRISLLPKADHYFAMDAQSAELLAGWGWNPDRLYLTGTVRFDQLQALNTEAERNRARALLLEDRYRHLIVFVSQTLSYDYCRAVLEVIAQSIGRRQDTKLLVKLHPREPEGNRAIYQSILSAAAPQRNWQVTADVAVEDALLASDLVIGVYSLALLEAACLRRPVIAANLSGKRLPEPTNLGDRACILGAGTASELTGLIASLLDDTTFRTQALDRQTQYFRQHSYMVDGGALERIVRTIEEVADGRPANALSLTQWRARQSASEVT